MMALQYIRLRKLNWEIEKVNIINDIGTSLIFLEPQVTLGQKLYTIASFICPDKTFFVQDNTEIVPDKMFDQG